MVKNTTSSLYNRINNASLYDEAFLQGVQNYEVPQVNAINLYNMYNNPSDKIPFTETLKKGTVDTNVYLSSFKQLYNRDGKYLNSKDNLSDGNYIVNINSFLNTNYKSMTGDKVRGAIDPGKGNPIRLTPPNGFYGYLECLTKNRVVGRVDLASAPSDISNNLSVETASDSPIGSSQPYTFFSTVGARQVSFTFDVYADYLPSPYNDVLSYCRALEQMNYPTYSSSMVNSPTVRFEYGGLHIIGIPTITCAFSNTIRRGIVDKATVSVSIIETEKVVDGKVIL